MENKRRERRGGGCGGLRPSSSSVGIGLDRKRNAVVCRSLSTTNVIRNKQFIFIRVVG